MTFGLSVALLNIRADPVATPFAEVTEIKDDEGTQGQDEDVGLRGCPEIP